VLFDQFTHNDVKLAWKYAFDRNFLKQNACIVKYCDIKYYVEGFEPHVLDNPLLVHLRSTYIFDLKLSAFLSGILDISIGKLRSVVNDSLITVNPACDIMKHRIKSDIDIFMKPLSEIIK